MTTETRIDRLSRALEAAAERMSTDGDDIDFARSLIDQFGKRGSLSDRQWPWVERLAARFEQLAGAEAGVAGPAYPRLAQSFLDAARDLKWPKLRLQTAQGAKLVLSRCGERSRTPGWINLTSEGGYGNSTFYGRISPEGAADLYAAVTEDMRATLAAYDADPEAEAKVQGTRTGACMCCGRELTDEISVSLGIGPICGKRWGISRAGVKAALRQSAAAVTPLDDDRQGSFPL